MALNTRGLDPRFSFAARPVVNRFMFAYGTLSRLVPQTPGTAHWDPHATVPADRVPAAPADATAIYIGPARVQPQLGWRGRRLNWRDETVTDQLVRIQLDMQKNELNGGVLPDVHVDDIFRVTRGTTLNGVEIDHQIKAMRFVVMNISPTSNSWVRTLFCDVVMD